MVKRKEPVLQIPWHELADTTPLDSGDRSRMSQVDVVVFDSGLTSGLFAELDQLVDLSFPETTQLLFRYGLTRVGRK